MKKTLLISSILLAAIIWFSPKTSHAAFSSGFYRTITVTSTASVASGTNSNFPMLVSSTLSVWKSSANGGDIQNLCTSPNGGKEPCDLAFATSSANLTAGNFLNFETESYTSSTGALVDWVNVPSMSTGTVIYVGYDDAGITTDQSHPSSTWNKNYQAVWHVPNGTVLNTSDSTQFANNATSSGASAAIGQIDGGFSGGSSGAVYESSFNSTSTGSVSLWFKPTWNSNDGIDHGLFGLGTNTPLSFLRAQKYTDNNWYIGWDNAGADDRCVVSQSSMTVSSGTWYLLSETWNTGAQSNVIYLNGVQTCKDTTHFGVPAVTDKLVFGAYTPDGSSFTTDNATNDEFNFLNTDLSPSWILTEYNNQKTPDDAISGTGFYHMGSETAFSTGGGNNSNALAQSISSLAGIFQVSNATFQTKNKSILIQ